MVTYHTFRMPFLSSVCVILIAMDLVNSQVTPSFNDWTKSGVEREAELMFRIIVKSQDYLLEISEDVARSETDATASYLSSQKELYDNTRKDVEFAAGLASRADYAQCAADARNQEVAIINKYSTQLQAGNRAFTDSASRFKSSQKLVDNSLGSYSLISVIYSFRDCNSNLNSLSNIVEKCYKSVMEDFTKKIQLANSALQSITSEYLVLRKKYLLLETLNKRVLSRAKNESMNVATATLKCAELDDRTPLQITVDEIAKLDACTLEDLKQNTTLANTLANGLKSKLNLAKSFTDNSLQATVQQCASVAKYLALFGLSSFNGTVLLTKIKTVVFQGTSRLNAIISQKMQTVNAYLDSVKEIYMQYKLSLGEVSEEILREECVPKDIKQQIIQEDETKMCLSKLYYKFSKSSKKAKALLAEVITNFKAVEKDVLSAINKIDGETKNTEKTIKDSTANMLVLFGYDPENICKIIENYFSSTKYESIVEKQESIKYNLYKVQLILDSLTFNLDSEVASVLSTVRETIEVIKLFNASYNTDALNAAHIKLETDMKRDLKFYVNIKYKEALNIISRALEYNYDKEISSIFEQEKCSSVDVCKIVFYFEARTSSFNNSLTKASRLSSNALTDLKYFTEKLWNEAKLFSELVYNKTKIIANNVSLSELNKAVSGYDCRLTAVLEYQALSDDKLKSNARAVVESCYSGYMQVEDSVKRTRLEIESLYRSLRLAYEKSYRETPDQPIPLLTRQNEIERDLNASYQNIKGVNDNTGLSRIDSVRNESSKRVVAYAKDIINSRCKCFIRRIRFDYCTKDIRGEYEKDLNRTEKVIEATLKDVDEIKTKLFELNNKIQAKELEAVSNKIKKELQELGRKS